MWAAAQPKPQPQHAPPHNTTNCWNARCPDGQTCYVREKGSKGGYALCLRTGACPTAWNCETRVPDERMPGTNRCGPSPLPSTLTPPPAEAASLLARHNASICE